MFLDYLKIQKGCTAGTIREYGSDLERFQTYLASQDKNRVSEVVKQDIYGFLSYLADPNQGHTPNKNASRARKTAVIKSFFNYLHREEIIDKNPALAVEIPRFVQTEPDFLSVEEYQNLLECIKEKATPYFLHRDLAIVSLFIATGIRLSELVGLKITDVDFKNQTILVSRKGQKEQRLPINTETAKVIQEYLAHRPDSDSNSLFLSKRLKGLDKSSVYRHVQNYFIKSGIVKKRMSPHTLRHTAITTLLSHNVHPSIIKHLAGHASYQTTTRYLHLNNQQLKDAVKNIKLSERKL